MFAMYIGFSAQMFFNAMREIFNSTLSDTEKLAKLKELYDSERAAHERI